MTRTVFGPVVVLVCVVSAVALSASRPGRRTLNLPSIPYRYAYLELPAHVTQPGRSQDNTPADNRLSDHGATLGRVLFYDTRLSANDTTSCASCHVQAHAFADPNPSSQGFHGALTDRRAMPLVNLRYYPRARFFWDERAGNLEEMVLLPIQHRIEMGQDLKKVVETLARDARYPVLFARAFGDKQITEQRIGKALAQFVRSLVSSESRYDEGRSRAPSAQADFENFTLQENRGKAPAEHDAALAVVRAHKPFRHINDPAGRNVQNELRALLDDEEFENFVAAASRLSRGPRIMK
jgi:cytochrome c peroxidase